MKAKTKGLSAREDAILLEEVTKIYRELMKDSRVRDYEASVIEYFKTHPGPASLEEGLYKAGWCNGARYILQCLRATQDGL